MFFYLRDQISLLFLYKNRKKIPYQFSVSAFEAYKVSNFTFGWVQHHATWETGDSRLVTCHNFSIFQLFFVQRKKTVCSENMNGIVEYTETTEE